MNFNVSIVFQNCFLVSEICFALVCYLNSYTINVIYNDKLNTINKINVLYEEMYIVSNIDSMIPDMKIVPSIHSFRAFMLHTNITHTLYYQTCKYLKFILYTNLLEQNE